MEEVRGIKVTGSKQMNDFIQLPKKIYRNIPQYVPEFESDVRGLFDIETNPGLEFSKIQPFEPLLKSPLLKPGSTSITCGSASST